MNTSTDQSTFIAIQTRATTNQNILHAKSKVNPPSCVPQRHRSPYSGMMLPGPFNMTLKQLIFSAAGRDRSCHTHPHFCCSTLRTQLLEAVMKCIWPVHLHIRFNCRIQIMKMQPTFNSLQWQHGLCLNEENKVLTLEGLVYELPIHTLE